MRERVRTLVAEHSPLNEAEATSIQVFLTHFNSLERPFDQHADPIHVTGSAIVTGTRGVILLKHRRLGIWLQPGGHLDPGETPWDTALRETQEETGLPARFVETDHEGTPLLAHVDVHDGGRGHTHLDLRYLLTAPDADPSPPPEESQEIHWFDWSQAIDRAGDERLAALLAHLGRGNTGLPHSSSGE